MAKNLAVRIDARILLRDKCSKLKGNAKQSLAAGNAFVVPIYAQTLATDVYLCPVGLGIRTVEVACDKCFRAHSTVLILPRLRCAVKQKLLAPFCKGGGYGSLYYILLRQKVGDRWKFLPSRFLSTLAAGPKHKIPRRWSIRSSCSADDCRIETVPHVAAQPSKPESHSTGTHPPVIASKAYSNRFIVGRLLGRAANCN